MTIVLYCNLTGDLRLWSLPEGQCIHSHTITQTDNIDSSKPEIVHAALCKALEKVAVVTFDHNIVLYDLETLTRHKQVCVYKALA